MRARDRISLGVSWLALAASVLLVGGALWWTQTIVAILIAIALAMQITTRRRLARVSPLLALLGVGATLTALQLLPFPAGLISALNPAGAQLRNDGAALLGTTPWSSLSMDPPTTLRALSYFVTLLGTALLGLRFAASERGRYYLICGVASVCGLAAVVTVVHVIFDVQALYGIYQPRQAAPPVLGPLLNANHLGGLMALGTSLSVGLTFYHRQSSHLRAVWFINSIGCALIAVASDSRGALIALVLGLVATFAMLTGARVTSSESRELSRPRAAGQDLSIFLVVAIALGVAVYASAGDVATELDNTSYFDVQQPLSKFAAWSSSTSLVAESPWVGVGRGGVEATLTRVYPASAYATFSHLENEYVSSVVEWGVPGALFAFSALGWCVASALRRWRDNALSAAALGGMLGVLFQASVDFGIQLLGLALPATVVAATVLLVPFRDASVDGRRRIVRITLVIAVSIGGLALVPTWARTVGEDHQALATANLAETREIAERHPLDYLAYAHAGELIGRKDLPLAVKLVNHAMRLHPTHAGLHRLAARVLHYRGYTTQAALEYRLALRGTIHPLPVLREIITTLRDPRIAGTAIPVDWRPREELLQGLTELGRTDIAIAWLRRVIEAPQNDTLAVDRLHGLAMVQHDWDSAAFAGSRRLASVNTPTSRWMLGAAEYERKNYKKVIAVLGDVAGWHGRVDEQSEAWLLLCQAHRNLGHLDEAIECIRGLERSGILVRAASARAHSLRSEMEQQKTAADRLQLLEPGAKLKVLEPGTGSATIDQR